MATRRSVIRTRSNSRAKLVPGSGPLARVPGVAVFALVIVLFGLAIWLRGPVGAGLLGVLAIGVLVLLRVTWSALRPADRVLRVVVLGILVAVAISMLTR